MTSTVTDYRKHVMAAAWRTARRGAKRFGGEPRQYLRLSLILCWQELRELAKPRPQRAWYESPADRFDLASEERSDLVAAATIAGFEKIIADVKAKHKSQPAGRRDRSGHLGWLGR